MWHDDLASFVTWCVETPNLDEFRAALASVPPARAAEVRAALLQELVSAGADEPTAMNLRVGVPLVERMRTPMALLRRQIRLSKIEILG